MGITVMDRDAAGEKKSYMIRKMADLLRAGATMLSESCPVCGSPLFKLRSGEIICPVHGRVHVVRSDEEVSRVTLTSVLDSLENAMTKRIQEAVKNLDKKGSDEEDLRNIVLMLEVLERVERVKKAIQPSTLSASEKKEKKSS